MDPELIMNRISMISLIIAGIMITSEGFQYLQDKKNNPKLSDKIYVVAYVAIGLGLFDVLIGIAHLWF